MIYGLVQEITKNPYRSPEHCIGENSTHVGARKPTQRRPTVRGNTIVLRRLLRAQETQSV